MKKFSLLASFFYVLLSTSGSFAEQNEIDKINCYSSYIMMNNQKHYLKWSPEEIFQEHQEILMSYFTEMMTHLDGSDPEQVGAMFMGFIMSEELWESAFDETSRAQIQNINPSRIQATFFARNIVENNKDKECPLYAASKFGR